MGNKDLKELNNGLYTDLKSQKGKVISLNNVVMKLQQDTAELRKHYLQEKIFSEDEINLTYEL